MHKEKIACLFIDLFIVKLNSSFLWMLVLGYSAHMTESQSQFWLINVFIWLWEDLTAWDSSTWTLTVVKENKRKCLGVILSQRKKNTSDTRANKC